MMTIDERKKKASESIAAALKAVDAYAFRAAVVEWLSIEVSPKELDKISKGLKSA